MATHIADIGTAGERVRPLVGLADGTGGLTDARPLRGLVFGGPEAKAKNREYAFYAITKNAGFVGALVWIALRPTGWVEWSAFAAFYVMQILSMSLGYHRYFTHRAFETSRGMRYALGILAQLGTYGSLMRWVADHRRHHALTDKPGDIHSPLVDAAGKPLSKWKGILHAHYGWVFDDSVTDMAVFGKGLADDEVLRFCHRTRYVWYGVSVLLLPAAWGFAFGGAGAILGTILVGGFLRMQLALHAIAAVNSIGHAFGSERFHEETSRAKNNWVLALLTLGEGWHNNHHAHPRCAETGLAWYELDPTGALIRVMEAFGLVWNVRHAPRYVRSGEGDWVEAPERAAA